MYSNLITLIVKIAEYIFRKEEIVKKGIDDVMGGKVLELESERLLKKGKSQGIPLGKEEVVLRMGERGYNLETISDATGFSIDQLTLPTAKAGGFLLQPLLHWLIPFGTATSYTVTTG